MAELALNLADLDSFTLVDPNSILLTDAYWHYEQIAKQHYDSMQAGLNLEYRPYQYQTAAMYASRRKNICGGAQGIGKTLITALTIASIYRNLNSCRPGTIHIAAPSVLSASTRWVQDLERVPALRGHVELITSERQVRASTKPIWVYQFDFPKRKAQLGTSRPYMSRLMYRLKRGPVFLIVDEVHNLRPNSERTKHLSYLRRKAKRVLALSGTLSDGRLDLIHTVGSFVYGQNWPMTLAEFKRTFGTKTAVQTNYLGGEEQLVEVPTRYLPHLAINKIPHYHDLMSSKVHRITLNDPSVMAVTSLPAAIPERIKVKMDPEHREHYLSVVTSYTVQLQQLEEFGGNAARVKAYAFLRPLIEASSCPEGQIPVKARAVLDLIRKGQQQGLKTVVFSSVVPAARMLTAFLKQHLGDEAVVRLYAQDPEETPKSLSDDRREEVLSRLLFSDVTAGVLSLNLAAESIDLTQISQLVFYDVPWQSIKVSQAICRAVRPGAVNPFVRVYYPVHESSIDEHMDNLTREKLKNQAQILDFDVEFSADASPIDPISVISSILSDQ